MVTLKNITYERKNHIIIDNLNIDCKDNKITFIIGENGAGKTTTLEIIDLLLKISSGKMRILDTIIDSNTKEKEKLELRRQIGLVFQNPDYTFLAETVKEELEISMSIFKYDKTNREKKIDDVLKIVDLEKSLLQENPLSLNSSNKRKLSLACVLLQNPKIILLDEPTIGLDNENKEELVKLIRKLKTRYHKTFIITSHDMDFVLRLSDYIYVINNGKNAIEGTKYEVFKQADYLNSLKLAPPKIIDFINKANKKTKLRYRDNINDLIKDIYRSVR